MDQVLVKTDPHRSDSILIRHTAPPSPARLEFLGLLGCRQLPSNVGARSLVNPNGKRFDECLTSGLPKLKYAECCAVLGMSFEASLLSIRSTADVLTYTGHVRHRFSFTLQPFGVINISPSIRSFLPGTMLRIFFFISVKFRFLIRVLWSCRRRTCTFIKA